MIEALARINKTFLPPIAALVPKKRIIYSPKIIRKNSKSIDISKYIKNILVKLFNPTDEFHVEIKSGDSVATIPEIKIVIIYAALAAIP